MNRIIKFRAWDGEMMLYYEPQTTEEYEAEWLEFFFKKCKVMQFTGLTDKNGKEIFEGDIVFNSNKTLLTLKEDKGLYLVKWENGCYNDENTWLKIKPGFTFEKIKTDGKSYISLIFNQSQIEVIGNIYENKTV